MNEEEKSRVKDLTKSFFFLFHMTSSINLDKFLIG